MPLLRSLLYAALFYPMTLLCVVAGLLASLFGRRPTFAVVMTWDEPQSLAVPTYPRDRFPA